MKLEDSTMIKPLQITTVAAGVARSGMSKFSPAVLLMKEKPALDIRTFQKGQGGVQDEISTLKQLLQFHQNKYEKIRSSLDKSFGSDWIFCTSELNDKQSDMLIDCISEQDTIIQTVKKLTQLQSKANIAQKFDISA